MLGKGTQVNRGRKRCGKGKIGDARRQKKEDN
jgi:hypothetical protein